MGVLTRSEIRDQVIVALGGRNDRSTTELNLYITLGYSLICQPEVRRHEELKARYDFQLVTDTDEYSVSKATVGYNILGIRLVEFIDSTTITVTARRSKLDAKPEEWWSNRVAFAVTGGPRYYIRDGNTLKIAPHPNAADNGKWVRVHNYREPTPLTDDAHVTVLADYFDEALIRAATYFAMFRLGYRELAINMRQELQTYCNQKLDAGETDTDPASQEDVLVTNL